MSFLQADCRSALPLPSHLLTIRPPDGDGREALGSSFYVVRGVVALGGDAVRSTEYIRHCGRGEAL